MPVGSLFLDLLPPSIGLALTPVAIAMGILLLASSRPVANDVSFTVPFVLVYGGLATLVLVAAGVSGGPLIGEHAKNVISLLAGLLLLFLAAGSWLRGRRLRAGTAPRAQARRSGMLDKVADARPQTSFGLGLTIAVLNPNVPILFAGLAVIGREQVGTWAQIGGAAMLVVASISCLVGPLLWYLAHPASAARGLARLRTWLARHEQTIDLGVLLVFGTLFTVKGIAGLA